MRRALTTDAPRAVPRLARPARGLIPTVGIALAVLATSLYGLAAGARAATRWIFEE